MRTRFAFSFASSALTSIFSGLHAQNTSGLLDTTNVETGLVRNGVLMEDDQVVLSLVADTGLWLWSCDASGIPLWSRRFGTDALWTQGQYPLTVCADNTLVFAYLSPQEEIGDSTLVKAHVVRVGADGVVLWDKEIATIPQEADGWWSSIYPQELRLVETSDNDLLLSLHIWEPTQYVHLQLLRLDGDGTFLWSKMLGYGAQPVFTEWNRVGPLAADGTGGCTLAFIPNIGAELGVISVDATGNLQWTITADYVLPTMEFRPLAVVTEADDRIVITSSMSSQYTDLQRMVLDPSGAYIRTDGYGDFWWLTDVRSVPLASGSALLLPNTYLEFDDEGQLVASLTLSHDGSDNLGDFGFGSRSLDIRSGQVLAAGDRSFIPFLPGLPTFSPAFIRDVIDAPGQCAYGGASATYIPLGSELFTFATDTAIHIADATVTVVDGMAFSSPMPMLQRSPMCSTVGILDAKAEPGFEVLNNPVEAGGTLHIRSAVPMDLHFLNLQGRSVSVPQRVRTTGVIGLAVGNLAPGIYVVTGLDPGGMPLGTERIVIR